MRKKYPGIEIIGPEYCFEENVRAREVAEKIFKEVPDLRGFILLLMVRRGYAGPLPRLVRWGW